MGRQIDRCINNECISPLLNICDLFVLFFDSFQLPIHHYDHLLLCFNCVIQKFCQINILAINNFCFQFLRYIYVNRGFKARRHILDVYRPSLNSHTFILTYCGRPPRWRRGSGLDLGSEDSGSIPCLPSPRVGPLMARR